MKEKSMCIFTISAIAVFAVLLTCASIWDLHVSSILADIKTGEYYSSNWFARAFEIFGEIPLYLFLAYAMSVIFWNAFYFGKPFVRYAVGILSIVMLAVICYIIPHRINSYIVKLNGGNGLSGLTTKIFNVLIAVGLATVAIVGVLFTGKINIKRQLSVAVLILFVAACSQIITQGLKTVNKRVRFRAMNFMDDFSRYTPWYKINGYPEEFKSIVEICGTSDAIRSFPSGHTASAGITYTLIALPFVFDKYNNKKWKIAFWAISLIYTGTVAVARIVMGAHYFSDVLIGGSAAFLFSCLGIWILYKKKAVKFINNYCFPFSE